MKLSCNVIDDLLPLYLDEVCSAESAALVEEHLAACPACREKLAALRQEEEKPLPVHLEEAKPVAELARTLKKQQKLRLIWAIAAVLLIAAAVFGGWYYYDYYYEQSGYVPLEDITVTASGVDEDGTMYFDLEISEEVLNCCGWTCYPMKDERTIYFTLLCSRKLTDEEMEHAVQWNTYSTREEEDGVLASSLGAEDYDRVVYRDEAGNELVLCDRNAEQ